MTGKDFVKREHWSLITFYFIGIVAFLIHLFFDYENKIFPLIAYSSMTIFFFRLAYTQLSKNAK